MLGATAACSFVVGFGFGTATAAAAWGASCPMALRAVAPDALAAHADVVGAAWTLGVTRAPTARECDRLVGTNLLGDSRRLLLTGAGSIATAWRSWLGPVARTAARFGAARLADLRP